MSLLEKDPYECEEEWIQDLPEEDREEVEQIIQDIPYHAVSDHVLELCIQRMEAKSDFRATKRDLESLPPSTFLEKWEWMKRGWYFFKYPRSWKDDVEELREKLQEKLEQEKVNVGRAALADELMDEKKERLEEVE